MNQDQILLISVGVIFYLAGLGYAFVKTGSSAKQKDEKRFGPLSNANIGLGYSLLRIKWVKGIIVIFCIGIGTLLIATGLKLIDITKI
jgi:hypothetical protein